MGVRSVWSRATLAAFFIGLLGLAPAIGQTAAVPPDAHPVDQTIKLDPKGPGKIFDGVGAISSSSSLLLYDYPEPQRGQVLDYLFKPNYGASLHIFKWEIGADTNSTTSAEPSHQRTPSDLNCHRGMEWWMAKEAKKRNPNIKLYALMWGAPGYFRDGKLWGDDHVKYLVSWLGCAKENGLDIDYLGGGNERGDPPPPVQFFVALKKAISTSYPNVKLVATDEHAPPSYWHFATEMKADPAYAAAVDILGEHDVCHWRSRYKHCDATLDARASGKPIWNNEQSTQDAASGAEPLARAMNRNYIDAALTGNINWAIVAGFYGNTGTGGQGLVLAETPWSGWYGVSKSVWVDAHTTQFVQPGWRYLDAASTYLTNDASFVTLYSPKTNDYSIVIETADATTSETVKFVPAAGLSQGAVHVWATDLSSSDPADWFVEQGTLSGGRKGFQIRIQPHHLYTLSTTIGQHKGDAMPLASIDVSARGSYLQGSLALPFKEDFEHVDSTLRARLFQDQAGAFEAQPCDGGRNGKCYQQVVLQQPVLWHNGGKIPSTLVGDPGWWGDYEVSVDALLQEPGHLELLGRVEQYNHNVISAYHFKMTDKGGWELYAEDMKEKEVSLGFEAGNFKVKLASGAVSMGVGSWHRLAMRFTGDQIVLLMDGKKLGEVRDDRHSSGQAGLVVAPWKRAQFDNFSVEKTRDWPVFAPHDRMTATASSSQPGVYQHRFYTPGEAIDGRFESRWSSQFDPMLSGPQSLTIDLGAPMTTTGLAYLPPGDTGRGGRITSYVAYVSADGKSFREVARGHWSSHISQKTATWTAFPGVRFVKLEALATFGDGAGATEVNVMIRP